MNKKTYAYLVATLQVTSLVLLMLLIIVSIKNYQESKQMIDLGGNSFNAKDIKEITKASNELGFKRIVVCDMEAVKCSELNTGEIK